MASATSADLRVDIISDVVCPWCIIGYRQLEEAALAVGKTLEVHWHPFELNPDMPAEGENLRDHVSRKYGSSAEESANARASITGLGAELSFTFDFKSESRIVNTLQAHKLIKWADGKGRQHDLKMALIRRYFSDGEDVSKVDVLLDAVNELGLDLDEAQAVIDDDVLSKETRQEEHFWHSKGISGVPSMVFEGQHLVTGAQGVENYKQIVLQLTSAPAK